MSGYGYDDQIDLLLLEVPEAIALTDFATDRDKSVIPYVLVGEFGSFVDCLLGGDRFRGISRTAAEACPDPADVLRRACGVLEAWANDDTPGVHDLLGAGFFEAFDEEGLERLAPHVGPATWAALQEMEADQFAGREQPKV